MSEGIILRAADRLATAWKNGGGVTREVAVYPAGASFETFDWRISIATVRSAGPFSQLPGVERILAVLEGQLCLQLAGHGSVVLSPESPPHALPGDVPTTATLPAGAVTDLNVMARRGRFRATLVRQAHEKSSTIQTGDDTTVLIALADLALETPGARLVLGALDAALFTGRTSVRLRPGPESAGYYRVELSALGSASASTGARTSVSTLPPV